MQENKIIAYIKYTWVFRKEWTTPIDIEEKKRMKQSNMKNFLVFRTKAEDCSSKPILNILKLLATIFNVKWIFINKYFGVSNIDKRYEEYPNDYWGRNKKCF